MRVLSIETSCDETSLAIFDATEKEGSTYFNVLSHLTNSQATFHAQFGGVFPKMAKREHQKNIVPLFIQVLRESKMLLKKDALIKKTYSFENLEREQELRNELEVFLDAYELPVFDLIIVTNGPGLEPTLWVGINFAKFLAQNTTTPLMPANHMEGHIMSVFAKEEENFFIPQISFPLLSLLISGGHTELILIENWSKYTKIGKTKDDAVGEAFDKVARLLGLPYPGGPEISKYAQEARGQNIISEITLPRPMIRSKDLDFSFSGLKTAVLYWIKGKNLTTREKQELAKEFEDAVSEVLVKKTIQAIHAHGIETLIVAGGVSANTHIKNIFQDVSIKENIQLYIPSKTMTGDNALMVGIAGSLKYLKYKKTPELETIVALGNLSL